MGVLDDAIREHLDLKRRRGADPTEVERAEREALGPVRRGPETGAEHDALDEVGFGPDHELDYDERDAPAAHDELEPEAPFAEPTLEPNVGPVAALRPAQDLNEAPLAATQAATPEAPPEPTPATEPAERALHQAPEDPEPAEGHRQGPRAGETAEYDVEEALKDEPHQYREGEPHKEGEAEDPLEETPEFLQDTPDHDRLWFEQRPPRDFNFDS